MSISKEKGILENFAKTIPASYTGPDRANYILENIENLSVDDKIALRNLFNKFLTGMIERDASDIEVGGHGNKGSIWMRVYGKKTRIEDLPQLSLDESGIIIINLLNSNQRKYLALTRNLDFSYTFFYERKNFDVRFRADAYFDLDTVALNMRAINQNIRSLKSLEFHPNVVKMMSHNYIKFGLSLVTGITGSGKSTTLDAFIDYHNNIDPCHIVIVASPIEYVHESKT